MPDRSRATLAPVRTQDRPSPLILDDALATSSGPNSQLGGLTPGPDHSAAAAASPSDLAIPFADSHSPLRSDPASGTPARDAYLDARAQVGAVGIALAHPSMRRALILDQLQEDYRRQAASLPSGYDADRRPPWWRAQQRAQWQRHRNTARALQRNATWQQELRVELGPDSEHVVSRARALANTREHILARSPDLQRDAVREELARDPQWLTDTLGPRPQNDAGRWQTLADQMAANRLRFLVADDADPGIRPEQSQLAHQVAHFHSTARLAHTLGVAAGIGLGI